MYQPRLATISKLRRVLPLRLHERVRALEQRLWFTTPTRPEPAPAAADTLLTVAEAAERRRTVTAHYQQHDGRSGQRKLSPYGVVLHGGRWYCVALDAQRDELRVLRLDRMSGVRIGGPAAPPPADLHPADFVATALARVPWGWEVEVLRETTLDRAAWRVAPGYGELVPCEAGVVLRMQVEDLTDAAGLLADLGCPFTVRRPEELRASVEALAHSLLNNAQRRPR